MSDKIMVIEPDNTDENSDWIKKVRDERLEKDKKVLSEKDVDKNIKIAIIDVMAKWWEGRKFKHPTTEHMVLFKSLPIEEQKRLNDMVKEKKVKEDTEKIKKSPEVEKDIRPNSKTLEGKVGILKNIYNNMVFDKITLDQKLLKRNLESLFPMLEEAIENTSSNNLEIAVSSSYLPNQYSYLFMDSPYPKVRRIVAMRVDVKDLHRMINDEDSEVREEVAKRIDQDGLKKMIKDEDTAVRAIVARRIDKKYCKYFVNDKFPLVRKEVALKADQEVLIKLINDDMPGIRKTVAERIDEKYLPVMMKDSASSVMIAVAQRIDERYLPKMLKDFAEGVAERKGDVMNAIAKRLSQDELHRLLKTKPAWLGTIKSVIAYKADQIGLKMMMKDELYTIRETVASRIDLKELPKMMNDEDYSVRYEVSRRVDYKSLLEMIKMERGISIKEQMVERKKRMKSLGLDTIEEFKKTGNFNIDKISNDLKEIIKNVDGESIKTEECSKCIDELYAQTDHYLINKETRKQWLRSSNNEGAAVLKEVIKELYGGEIRHHDDIGQERWNTYFKNAMWRWNKEDVFNYVKVQKSITEKLLDLKYPGQEEFDLYRGTHAPEEQKDIGKNCKILTNSLSSWTLKEKVARSFGKIVLRTKFKKDEIFSCFLTHSHTGFENEFITIGKEEKTQIPLI